MTVNERELVENCEVGHQVRLMIGEGGGEFGVMHDGKAYLVGVRRNQERELSVAEELVELKKENEWLRAEKLAVERRLEGWEGKNVTASDRGLRPSECEHRERHFDSERNAMVCNTCGERVAVGG